MVGGVFVLNSYVRSSNAVNVTGIGMPGVKVFVWSLNFLQNSTMLTPSGPSACPIAGDGCACPDKTRIFASPLMATDIVCQKFCLWVLLWSEWKQGSLLEWAVI